MFIRKKPRKSARGITFDFYVIQSVRTPSGPRQKIRGYLACIEERFIADVHGGFHRKCFWEGSKWAHGGARAKIANLAAKESLSSDETVLLIENLTASLARYVSEPTVAEIEESSARFKSMEATISTQVALGQIGRGRRVPRRVASTLTPMQANLRRTIRLKKQIALQQKIQGRIAARRCSAQKSAPMGTGPAS